LPVKCALLLLLLLLLQMLHNRTVTKSNITNGRADI